MPMETVIAPLAQQLVLPGREQRMEGLAWSACGRWLAVATSDTDHVHCYHRASVYAPFPASPACSLAGDALRYPHDVAFSPHPQRPLLAVAQRTDSLLLYRLEGNRFGPRPAAIIGGDQALLHYSDALAFLPPLSEQVAVANLRQDTVTFYRVRDTDDGVEAVNVPTAVFHHPLIREPDGIAFTADGRFMALANHGDHSVVLFRREPGAAAGAFDAEPAMVIRDPYLLYPHSVAFTAGDHLLVTNAGSNHVGLYRRQPGDRGARWSRRADARYPVTSADVFARANCDNKMEGGPKGVATWRDCVAVCSPQVGTKILRPATADGAPGGWFDWRDEEVPCRSDTWSNDQGALVHGRRRHALRLNAAAEAVLALCRGAASVGEIIRALAAAFPGQPGLADQVREALGLLERHDVIRSRRTTKETA